MTTPTPAIPGLPDAVPPASSSDASTSRYGLTNGWGSQLIDLTGLPTAVVRELAKPVEQGGGGLTTSALQSGDAIMQALATMKDRGAVAQVQQMLYYGGFDGSDVTNLTDLQLGRFTAREVAALKTLVQSGGQTGERLGSYLVGAANYGQAQGTIKQVLGAVTPTTIPNTYAEDAAIRAAATNLLGRDANASEVAQFRGVVDQMVATSTQQANVIAGQDPQALGDAAGRLGEPGYFGDPNSAPPTPAPPLYWAKPGSPSQPQRGVQPQGRGISGATDRNAAANNAADYYNQRTADQNAVGSFTAEALNDTADSPLPTSSTDLEGAAEQYLRENDAGAMQAQDWAEKTRALYAILAGNGQ